MISKNFLSILLIGLLLSSCASVQENTLLAPTRSRPELGVRLRVIEPDPLPAQIVGERPRVLLVIGVKPEQPAARAGIELGDVLLSVAGQSVSGMADSVAIMQNQSWGNEVMLTVLRDGQLQDIPVALNP